MKANELMIGDWVQFPMGYEKVQEIGFVQGHGYCASFAASATLFPVEIDKIEPIPLTAEILEKNGFVNGEEVWAANCPEDKNLLLEITWDDTRKVAAWSINCNEYCVLELHYVHELQHALRLCGIDKNIVL